VDHHLGRRPVRTISAEIFVGDRHQGLGAATVLFGDRIQRRGDRGGLVGRQLDRDSHHALVGCPLAIEPLGLDRQALAARRKDPRPAQAGDQLLELLAGHQASLLQKRRLGLGVGDPGERPDFGVRELAGRKRPVDERQLGERAGDSHPLVRRSAAEPGPPRQPRRAASRSRDRPTAALVEAAEQGELPVTGLVHRHRDLGDLVAHLLEIVYRKRLVYRRHAFFYHGLFRSSPRPFRRPLRRVWPPRL
jgi:hypothetical protein